MEWTSLFESVMLLLGEWDLTYAELGYKRMRPAEIQLGRMPRDIPRDVVPVGGWTIIDGQRLQNYDGTNWHWKTGQKVYNNKSAADLIKALYWDPSELGMGIGAFKNSGRRTYRVVYKYGQ